MRVDDQRVAIDDERVAVGFCTRLRLICYRGPAARAIFNDDGWPVGLVDLLTKKPRENIGTAARGKRYYDPDRSCRLAPSALIGKRQEDKGQRGNNRWQTQKSIARKFHDVPLTTPKICDVR